jgi:putative membrane protein
MSTTLRRAMRRSLAAGAVALLVAACGGDANEQGAATPDSLRTATVGAAAGDVGAAGNVNPQEAVAFMAAANQSEVQAAQVAVNKATDPEVRRFAQKMQTEHAKSAHEVGELAKRMNVSLESSAQQGQMVQSLQQMSQQMSQQLNSTPKGQQFDRVYIDGQVQAHQAVLENLQRIAGTTGATGATPAQPPGGAGRDTTQGAGSPQQAAQTMIPHVQQHLDEARRIQAKLQGGAR